MDSSNRTPNMIISTRRQLPHRIRVAMSNTVFPHRRTLIHISSRLLIAMACKHQLHHPLTSLMSRCKSRALTLTNPSRLALISQSFSRAATTSQVRITNRTFKTNNRLPRTYHHLCTSSSLRSHRTQRPISESTSTKRRHQLRDRHPPKVNQA